MTFHNSKPFSVAIRNKNGTQMFVQLFCLLKACVQRRFQENCEFVIVLPADARVKSEKTPPLFFFFFFFFLLNAIL